MKTIIELDNVQDANDQVLVTSEINNRIRICVNSCRYEFSYCGGCEYYKKEPIRNSYIFLVEKHGYKFHMAYNAKTEREAKVAIYKYLLEDGWKDISMENINFVMNMTEVADDHPPRLLRGGTLK